MQPHWSRKLSKASISWHRKQAELLVTFHCHNSKCTGPSHPYVCGSCFKAVRSSLQRVSRTAEKMQLSSPYAGSSQTEESLQSDVKPTDPRTASSAGQSQLLLEREQRDYNKVLGLELSYLHYLSLQKSGRVQDRPFDSATSHLWNSLPSQCRTQQDLDSFKAGLKVFLFRKAWTNLKTNEARVCWHLFVHH